MGPYGPNMQERVKLLAKTILWIMLWCEVYIRHNGIVQMLIVIYRD